MENRINNGRRIIIGLLVILFLYDAFKYNQIGGPNFEITNYLFKMILFIDILLFFPLKTKLKKQNKFLRIFQKY